MNNLYHEVKPFEVLLKSIAFNLTKSTCDAEDLLHDTYFKACKSISKFEQGSNLKAWMITIMKNTFINNYRKKKREMATLTKPGNLHDGLLMEGSEVPEPSVRILLNETLIKALDRLNPEMKYIFMQYYKGYKYQEIADELELPLGTVKSKIFLARKELVFFLNQNDIYHSSLAS